MEFGRRFYWKLSFLCIIGLIALILIGCDGDTQLDDEPTVIPIEPPEDVPVNELAEFFNETPTEIQIVLDKGVCFGECPAYYFIIFGDGEAYLLTNHPSYNLSKAFIAKEEIVFLLQEFEKRRFFNYNDSYNLSGTPSGQATSIGLKLRGKSKWVHDYASRGPEFQEFGDIVESVKENTLFTQVNLTPEICEKMYSNSFYFLGKNWSESDKKGCYFLLDSAEECLEWYQTADPDDYSRETASCRKVLGLLSINLGIGEWG